MMVDKQRRYKQMRNQAQSAGKYVPSRDELEQLFNELINMACPVCGRTMHWNGKDGMAGVITLQHDRTSSRIRLMCGACNSHHNHLPGDMFYDIPPGTKLCPQCKEIKPRNAFSTDNSQASKLKSWCKPCSYAHHHQWARARRELLK